MEISPEFCGRSIDQGPEVPIRNDKDKGDISSEAGEFRTTPIEDEHTKTLQRELLNYEMRRQLGLTEGQLTSRQYLYRPPGSEDIKVAVAKVVVYGCVGAVGAWMIKRGQNQELGVVLGCILVMSAVMVIDALCGLWQTAIRRPSVADLLLPMQNANWGLLPLPILHWGAAIVLVIAIGRLLFGG